MRLYQVVRYRDLSRRVAVDAHCVVCAGAVAQFVGGRRRVTRCSLDLTSLPAMLMATLGLSILLVAVNTSSLTRFPARLVRRRPGQRCPVPRRVAAGGSRAGSPPWSSTCTFRRRSVAWIGFWLIASERFDLAHRGTAVRPDRGRRDVGGLFSACLGVGRGLVRRGGDAAALAAFTLQCVANTKL